MVYLYGVAISSKFDIKYAVNVVYWECAANLTHYLVKRLLRLLWWVSAKIIFCSVVKRKRFVKTFAHDSYKEFEVLTAVMYSIFSSKKLHFVRNQELEGLLNFLPSACFVINCGSVINNAQNCHPNRLYSNPTHLLKCFGFLSCVPFIFISSYKCIFCVISEKCVA